MNVKDDNLYLRKEMADLTIEFNKVLRLNSENNLNNFECDKNKNKNDNQNKINSPRDMKDKFSNGK